MPWVEVTPTDVANRWRPLTAEEIVVATAIIADAQDILEDAILDLGFPEVDPDDEAQARRYVRIVAAMVKRVLINPDGVLEESVDGEYSYRRDKAVSAGLLYIDPSEVDQFRPVRGRRRRGAFSVTLSKS